MRMRPFHVCSLLRPQDAHDAALVSLHFFAGEPLLMSSGADNAVKHWVSSEQTCARAFARLLQTIQ